jgi:hypothetical protein
MEPASFEPKLDKKHKRWGSKEWIRCGETTIRIAKVPQTTTRKRAS